MQNKYKSNGSPEDIKAGILHSNKGFYVSNEGTKVKPNYHVWVPGLTHSVCDSAYGDISLAVCRCDYLAERFPTSSEQLKLAYNIERRKRNK